MITVGKKIVPVQREHIQPKSRASKALRWHNALLVETNRRRKGSHKVKYPMEWFLCGSGVCCKFALMQKYHSVYPNDLNLTSRGPIVLASMPGIGTRVGDETGFSPAK